LFFLFLPAKINGIGNGLYGFGRSFLGRLGLILRLNHAWHLALSSIVSDYSKKPIGIEAFQKRGLAFQKRGLAFSDIFISLIILLIISLMFSLAFSASHIPLGHIVARGALLVLCILLDGR
jgi:hypothetical protein